MNDTSRQIVLKIREMMLRKSPEERLQMACSMYDFSKSLVISGIAHERPGITPDILRLELFRRFYENDFDAAQKKKIMEYLARSLPQS